MEQKNIEQSVEIIAKSVEVLPAVEKAVASAEERIKQLEAELIKIKSAVPTSESDKKAGEIQKRLTIIKAMSQGRQEHVAKAISETVGTAGGQLGGFIPEQWSTDIASAVYSYGKVAANSYRIPMASLTMNYSEYVDGIGAVFITTAGTAITSGVPSAVQHTLTAKELSALTIYNAAFLADAGALGGPAVVNRVQEDAARQIAAALEYAILRGDGTVDTTNGGITGVLNAAANVVTAGTGAGSTFQGALTVANLATMVDAVPYTFSSNMGWIMHRSLRPYLRALTGGPGGSYIWSPGDAANGMVDTIYGYPVYWIEGNNMPAASGTATGTKFAAFGDLNSIKIGERSGIEIAVSDQWLFSQNQVAIRWIYRVDAWVLGKNWAVLKTANS